MANHAPLFFHMIKIIRETVFILILSFFLSVIYTAVSPSGIHLLKKAFRIKTADGAANAGPEVEGTSAAVRK